MTAEPAPYPEFDGTQACAQPDVNPDWWFPESPAPGAGTEAIDVCEGCTFRRQCLAYALTNGVVGVWGGTTDATRRDIRAQYHIRPVAVRWMHLPPTSTDAQPDEETSA